MLAEKYVKLILNTRVSTLFRQRQGESKSQNQEKRRQEQFSLVTSLYLDNVDQTALPPTSPILSDTYPLPPYIHSTKVV